MSVSGGGVLLRLTGYARFFKRDHRLNRSQISSDWIRLKPFSRLRRFLRLRCLLLSLFSKVFQVFNMADDGKEEKVSSRGADWEVVSLTASAYAAEPGLQEFDPTSERKEKENMTERESSAALFVSGHFVFPPSEHENLRVDPDTSKIHGEPTMIGGDNGIYDSGREKLQSESDDDQYGIEFSEGNRISFRDMGFEEGKGSHRLNLVGVEQDIFADPHSVDTHSEAHKSSTKSEAEEPSDVNMESPHDHAKPGVGEIDGSNLPCQAWWKKHAVSLYKQAKEAGTFWPVVVAAAVMGIIIVGQRWHQDKWRFSINNERMSRMMRPIGRFKDVLVDGRQPNRLIR
ncbi:hypothetical protein OPV22_001657 [Ensete ventricosum]|uniref:ATG8-interacting protein 1 n=1 Tax=Ensete ventricosum TaxID=4639 RepID=A0AAV8RV13_ENSVE|nr:hypothetical protein OPV22_001657 [Ensete ventricosum]